MYVVALVEVKSPLHTDALSATQLPKHQLTSMTWHWTVHTHTTWTPANMLMHSVKEKTHFIGFWYSATDRVDVPVLVGNRGMSLYGKLLLSSSRSARPPRPEPQMMATLGRCSVCFSSQSAVSLYSSYLYLDEWEDLIYTNYIAKPQFYTINAFQHLHLYY